MGNTEFTIGKSGGVETGQITSGGSFSIRFSGDDNSISVKGNPAIKVNPLSPTALGPNGMSIGLSGAGTFSPQQGFSYSGLEPVFDPRVGIDGVVSLTRCPPEETAGAGASDARGFVPGVEGLHSVVAGWVCGTAAGRY